MGLIKLISVNVMIILKSNCFLFLNIMMVILDLEFLIIILFV